MDKYSADDKQLIKDIEQINKNLSDLSNLTIIIRQQYRTKNDILDSGIAKYKACTILHK